MNVKELVTTWGFDVDTKPLEQMDMRLDVLKGSVLALTAEIGVVVGAVYAFVKTTADAGYEANDLAQSMGTTTQAIQKLQYAAHIAGVGEGEMEMGLRRISMAAVSASKGAAETNLIFGQLGISIYDNNGKLKNSTTLLRDVAGAFQHMPDGPLKTTAAVELLGRSGTKLIPILNGGTAALDKLGDEAVRSGYVMSTAQVQAAVVFTEGLHKLELIVISLKRSIGDQLMPVFVNLIDKFQKWYDQNKAFIDSAITQIVEILANAFVRGAEAIMNLVNGVKALLTMTGALDHLKAILIVVAGLFAAMTMATAIESILSMIPIIMKLVEALRLAAVFEAIASGGASLWLGLAAGAAAMAATGYLMSGSGASASGSSGMPTMPPMPTGPSNNTTTTGGQTTVNHQSTINVNTAPGTSAQQASEIAKIFKGHTDDIFRNAAAGFSTPTPGALISGN